MFGLLRLKLKISDSNLALVLQCTVPNDNDMHVEVLTVSGCFLYYYMILLLSSVSQLAVGKLFPLTSDREQLFCR